MKKRCKSVRAFGSSRNMGMCFDSLNEEWMIKCVFVAFKIGQETGNVQSISKSVLVLVMMMTDNDPTELLTFTGCSNISHNKQPLAVVSHYIVVWLQSIGMTVMALIVFVIWWYMWKLTAVSYYDSSFILLWWQSHLAKLKRQKKKEKSSGRKSSVECSK